MKRRLVLLSVLLMTALSACASYNAAPLDPLTAVLAKPDMAILSADAGKIDRPWLTPQSIDLAQPLTPNALAVIAIIENPDLKALRTKSGVAAAQAFAARLLPDPTAQLGFDKLLSGPDAFNGFAGQLGFDLNALRTARVTRESGEAAKRQVRLDLAWVEWQTAEQARLQGVRIVALEAQIDLAKASATAAEHLFRAVENAAGRGDLAAGEVDARRLATLDADEKYQAAARDLTTARGELNKLLGLPPETTLHLATPPQPAIAPASSVLVTQAIDRRLDLQALRAGYDVAEGEMHRAILNQFPNLSLTIASARDTAGNYTLGPQVGFTLPLWNRNRGGIAVVDATRAQLRAEYDARLFQTRAEIAAAVAGLATIRQQRAELLTKLPAIERFAASSTRAAQRGDLALALAATAAQSLRDRKTTLLQLDQQAAETTIALELLSGGPSEGWTR
ncbi:TolC family protein [Sphingomonas paeninsulae]|uniref:TolC family protein n=1 Tax=Sphingomonas paeninsulae TaxID=2319844 RepID=A0A494T9K4_SPHPE|nr:TolC family protein [Sphingomonas paeninsulae]AYJ85640.1 TolC family protein [Sphingomonas paeninsulae]